MIKNQATPKYSKHPYTAISRCLLESGIKGYFKNITTDNIMNELYPFFSKETQEKYFNSEVSNG